MGDSRDKVRADCRSRQTRPLSRKITTVCCQESRFRAVGLLGRIDLAAIKSSSASACTDALAASLTFGGDPQIRRTRHPCVLRWRSAENDHDAPLFFPSVCRLSWTSVRRHALSPSRTCQQRLLTQSTCTTVRVSECSCQE